MIKRILQFIIRYYWKLVYQSYRRQYQLSNKFKFNGHGTIFYGNGNIQIGDKSYLGRGCYIQAVLGYSVKIGKNCAISHRVSIYTQNRLADQDMMSDIIERRAGDVLIGDGCWIGMGVFIKEGVTIGKNVVIGANSVVVKDLPDNAIAAGIPAKILRTKAIN